MTTKLSRRLFPGIAATAMLMFASSALMAQRVPSERSERHPKYPWEWTIDERLAERLDPARIRERDEAYYAAHPQARAMDTASRVRTEQSTAARPAAATVVYRIDGSRNPELFLPTEVFDAILSGLGPDEALSARQRAYYQPAISGLGYDPDTFWAALKTLSADYLPIRFGRHTAGETQCRQRFDALAASRAWFGQTAFDRILYAVVAPTMVFSETTLDPDPINAHRRAEMGCR